MDSKRFNFLSVKISAENLRTATEKIVNYNFSRPSYICFPDASVVKAANDDPFLLKILNSSFLTLPDGKPSQLAAKLQGFNNVSTVSGFFLIRELLNSNLTHYFYGGDEEVLTKMRERITVEYPNAKILGYKAPPFVALSEIEHDKRIALDLKEISLLSPNLVWIGVSSPKQDYIMHFFHQNFANSLLIGVGGVFLYLSDDSLKSPEWIKRIGMRWAYRLLMEPKRLWPKYYGTIKFLLSNAGFFFSTAKKRHHKV